MHHSIEKNYTCDHSVLHGFIGVYSYIAHLYTFRIQNNYTHVFTAVILVSTAI